MAAPAIALSADGLRYAGLGGAILGYPILALHGWLDNALSFASLASLLTIAYRAGPIRWSRRPSVPDATYHIWDIRNYCRSSTSLIFQSSCFWGIAGVAISVLLAAH